MNELKEIFRQLESITMSCKGKETDWGAKNYELDSLLERLRSLKIECSLNSSFYNWIAGKLSTEILDEKRRLLLLCVKHIDD